MNENDFRDKLQKWGMKYREVIVPSAIIVQDRSKVMKIFTDKEEEFFYEYVPMLKIDDKDYERYKADGFSDKKILGIIRRNYDNELKRLKKRIRKAQKKWSDSFVHERAQMLIDYLGYKNVWILTEMTKLKCIPIELVLSACMNYKVKYSIFRNIKEKNFYDVESVKLIEKFLKRYEVQEIQHLGQMF